MKNVVILLFLVISSLSFGYINIYPTQVVEELSEKGVYKSFELYNGTNKPRRYRILFEEDSKVSSWAEVSPKSITLLPGEKKEIKLEIKYPKNQNQGRYRGELSFKEVKVANYKAKDAQLVFTEYKLPIILYIGEKNIIPVDSLEVEDKKIDFLDINKDKLIYSTDGRSYIKDLENGGGEIQLPFEVVENCGNSYIVKNLGDSENEKYSLVSRDLRVPLMYSREEIKKTSNINIFVVKNNGHYALVKQNTPITEYKYDDISGFRGNFAIFSIDDKYGILRLSDGVEILSGKADEVFLAKNGNWIAKIGGKYQTSKFKLDIESIRKTEGEHFIYKKNGKYGILNLEKMIFTQPQFDEITSKVNNSLLLFNGKKYAIATINDLELEKPVEYKYDIVGEAGENTYSIADIKTRKYSYYNTYSGLNTPHIYDVVYFNGEVCIAKKDDRADMYNKYGRYIGKVIPKNIKYIGKDFVIQKDGDKYMVIDIREIE